MFVGHYSAAFVAKAAEPRIPIWVLLLAAQLVDVFWVAFVLAGVEVVRIDPTLPSNPLDLHHMPYTHSLLGAASWAGAAALLVARARWLGGTLRAGAIVGLVVVSHWVLDFVVHRPDLTLWGAPPKLGLALWDEPLLAHVLELSLVAASAAVYAVHCRLPARSRRCLAIAVLALVGLQTAVAVGPLPTSVPALVLSVLVVFVGVAYAGLRGERWARQSAA